MKPLNIETRLVVYRDFIESNGKWRLFWEDLTNPGCGFDDESTVTGNPFFDTLRQAKRYACLKYQLDATKVTY